MDEGIYIAYTEADNGVRHAWGPFPTRSAAQAYVRRAKRRFKRDYPQRQISISIHRVLQPGTGLAASWPDHG